MSSAAVLRSVYAGEALKRGRVLELGTFSTEIPGRVLLDALSLDAAPPIWRCTSHSSTLTHWTAGRR